MKKTFAVRHDLSKLSADEVKDYLRDVSEFIGLDPELHGLDTIWMQNESGPGQSLVVYARRGTAEILRNKLGIEVSSLTNQMVKDSIVFTATGKAGGRQEVATGSKFIGGLQGKALDDAIMTASTRALRRLTMQFTSLGILDESEVKAVVGDTANPAANAQPIGDPIVIPPMPTAVNNAPGKDITPLTEFEKQVVVPMAKELGYAVPTIEAPEPDIAKVYAQGAAGLAAMPVPGQADIKAAQNVAQETVTPVAVQEMTASPDDAGASAKPKRARKSKNTVSMDVEPETVNKTPVAVPEPVTPLIPATAPLSAVVPPPPVPLPPAAPVAAPADPNEFPGKPSAEQMADYRKRVSVYTAELPASVNMGSVQKMRAFLTKMSGTPPQTMSTDQWEEMLSWFESFVDRNKIKGLVTYINDNLGVK